MKPTVEDRLQAVTARLLSLKTVSAAKDAGDAKLDKARRSTLNGLIQKAASLSQQVPDGAFPEVAEALKTVQSTMELVVKMEEVSARLRASPNGSAEAVDAQKNLDKMRANVDGMLPGLSACMGSMESLLLAAIEMEEQSTSLKESLEAMQTTLDTEKKRLASAAQAVQNLAKTA